MTNGSALIRNGRVDYEAVRERLAAPAAAGDAGPAISDAWAGQYRAETGGEAELVEVDLGTLTYLFDVAGQRVVGVYGTSAPTGAPRPNARMRGHPSYNKPGQAQTDRGHLAAHAIGGGTDMNLVPQAHALNVSRGWRDFERHLQRHLGTFFLVQVEYADETQRPSAFVYGAIRDGAFRYERFVNV